MCSLYTISRLVSAVVSLAIKRVTGGRLTRLDRLWANRDELIGPYAVFDHFNNDNHAIPFNSLVGWMQTFPAWVGLIFCFVIIFVFSTASWWNHKEAKGSDIPAAFAAVSNILLSALSEYISILDKSISLQLGKSLTSKNSAWRPVCDLDRP
jgi:H+/Cl- antiporter ClcA